MIPIFIVIVIFLLPVNDGEIYFLKAEECLEFTLFSHFFHSKEAGKFCKQSV